MAELADAGLGQYFLVDPTQRAVLVEHAGIQPDERVVELGAGAGTIARLVPPCRELTLAELNPRLEPMLGNRWLKRSPSPT